MTIGKYNVVAGTTLPTQQLRFGRTDVWLRRLVTAAEGILLPRVWYLDLF
jgi:hypothetical protein